MTNREFYAFCRDQRKIEPDPAKHEALEEVYGYLWECGVTKGGVAQYIATRIDQQSNKERPSTKIDNSQEKQHTLQTQIDAYEWLLGVFNNQKSGNVGNEPTLWR